MGAHHSNTQEQRKHQEFPQSLPLPCARPQELLEPVLHSSCPGTALCHPHPVGWTELCPPEQQPGEAYRPGLELTKSLGAARCSLLSRLCYQEGLKPWGFLPEPILSPVPIITSSLLLPRATLHTPDMSGGTPQQENTAWGVPAASHPHS